MTGKSDWFQLLGRGYKIYKFPITRQLVQLCKRLTVMTASRLLPSVYLSVTKEGTSEAITLGNWQDSILTTA